jgi:acyl carrier protein phosphodiesterase
MNFLAHLYLSGESDEIKLGNFLMLPTKVKQFLPFLIHHKRLESYAQRESLYHVLEIMSKRTSLPANSEWAMTILHQEYDQFEWLFRRFFAELTEYVEMEFSIQIAKPEPCDPGPLMLP